MFGGVPGKVLDIDKRLLLEKGSDFETLSELPKGLSICPSSSGLCPHLQPLPLSSPLPFTARPLSSPSLLLPPRPAPPLHVPLDALSSLSRSQSTRKRPPALFLFVWPFAAHLPQQSLPSTRTRPIRPIPKTNNHPCKTTPSGQTRLPTPRPPTSS